MEETKIIYHIDEESTPYLIKLSIPHGKVTLEDFKIALNKPNYKYFFKSNDEDFGTVKEEVSDDTAILPCFDGKVKAWLVTAEGSGASDTQSDVGRLPGSNLDTNSHSSKKKINSDEVDNFSATSGDRLPPLKNFKNIKNSKLNRYNQKQIYDPSGGSSILSSDIETTSFLDSEEESTRFSTATGTSFSSKYAKYRRKVKKHKMKKFSKISEDESSFSSMTDSTMSLNIVSVTLQMDAVNFLGISIVGQSNKAGDGGIYVGSIMKDGAVARDGRIDPGDMILEVNGISFEDMSNDDAVMVLRKQVQIPGPITLVVAKCWDSNPKSYVCFPPEEPIKPVDPRAWVLHSNAFINENNLSNCNDAVYNTQTGGEKFESMSMLSSNNLKKSINSDSMSEFLDPSKVSLGNGHSRNQLSPINYTLAKQNGINNARSVSSSSNNGDNKMNGLLNGHNMTNSNGPIFLQSINQLPTLSVSSDTNLILVAAQMPDSGLDIHDRVWLKIVIPNAFIGSELVNWLYSKVDGFADRKEAKSYASDLLRYKHIRHIVNKSKFSEPCYYVFCQTVQDLISSNPATFGYYKVSNMEASESGPNQQQGLNPMNMTMTDSNGYTAAWPNYGKDVHFTHYPLGVEGSVKNGPTSNNMTMTTNFMHDPNQFNQSNVQMPISQSQNFPNQRMFQSSLTGQGGHQNSSNYPRSANINQYFPNTLSVQAFMSSGNGGGQPSITNNSNNNQNNNEHHLSSGSSTSSSDGSDHPKMNGAYNSNGLSNQFNHLSIHNGPYSGPSVSSHSNSSQQNHRIN